MSGYALKAVTALGNIVQGKPGLLLAPARHPIVAYQIVRGSKHWLPKWKKLRGAKFIKIDLPDFHGKVTEEKARAKMRERGLLPARPWMERPMFISCTGGIIEEYVPPEGDGKFSALSKAGAKQKVQFIGKKGKTLMAIRKIKSYEEEFSVKEFPVQAQEIYIKAHEALVSKDRHALRTFVTERAYPEMRHNSIDKTIHWRFIESLEPARVVQVKCINMITKDNHFAQVTVRFHNQQTLAIYDRFGRLMSGSEIVKKDVLEYVVFEKHITHEYGSWRVHGKILPPWAPPREFGERTFIDTPIEPEPEPEAVSTAAKTTEAVSTVATATKSGPIIASKETPEIKAQPVA